MPANGEAEVPMPAILNSLRFSPKAQNSLTGSVGPSPLKSVKCMFCKLDQIRNGLLIYGYLAMPVHDSVRCMLELTGGSKVSQLKYHNSTSKV